MPEMLSALFAGAAALAIIAMALSFIFTSLRRKRVHCPECGAKTPPAVAYYTHPATGKKVQGEPDIPFALVAGGARLLIGLVAIGYVFALLLTALGYGHCELQGISMACSSVAGGEVEFGVNLIYSLAGIVGGVFVIYNGALRLMMALYSRGKTLTTEYICHRDHHWIEPGSTLIQ